MESPPRFELIDVSSPAGSFSTDLPLLLHSMCSCCCCCCHCCLLYGLPWSLAHRYMTYPALVSLVAFELTIFACLQAKGKKQRQKRQQHTQKTKNENWSQAWLSPFPCLFISFCFGFLYHKLYTSGSFCFFGCCRLRVRSLSARCAHILLIVLFMMLLLLLQELLLLSGTASSSPSPSQTQLLCQSRHIVVITAICKWQRFRSPLQPLSLTLSLSLSLCLLHLKSNSSYVQMFLLFLYTFFICSFCLNFALWLLLW